MKRLRSILQFRYLLIILLFFLILSLINKKYLIKRYSINDKEFVLKVTSVDFVNDKYKVELKGIEKLISYPKDFEYNIGDVIKVNGTLSTVNSNTIPNVFDYKKYLKYQDINYVLNIDTVYLISKNKNILYKVKETIKNIIKNRNSFSYLNSFIMGNTTYLNSDIKSIYQKIGISHLFSISGTHITLITLLFSYLYKKKKINNTIYFLLINTIVIFYLFLTNYKVSILRFVLFFDISFINKKVNLGYDNLKTMIIVILLSLIINPYYFFQTGFEYSYLISFFLIRFSNLIKGNYFRKLLKISIISIITSFPITIYNNYEINLLSIIYNLFYVPLVSFILFPLSILIVLFPILDNILMFFINVLENSAIFLSKINVLTFIFAKPSFLLMFVYLVLIYFSFSKKKKVLLIIVIIIHYNINAIRKDSYVMALDVGEGDSLIIKNKNKTILIDTGGSPNYSYYKDIITYLKSDGIRKINYLILSHGDFDHMGETINIVENFKVDKIIFNCDSYTDLEKNLIKVLDKKKIKYYSCIKELSLNNNKLLFLQTRIYDNENDNSNVIYTELNGYKFMFMGDAGLDKEKDILDKYNVSNIDILKVGHHGSNTSTGQDFINRIKPKYSIISVGKNNRYGHPNKEVLNNLKNSIIYRTDINGSILFRIKKSTLSIETRF